MSGLLCLNLRIDHNTPSALARYGGFRNNEYPRNQWLSRGTGFALQQEHLRWAILCSESEIIGTTAGPVLAEDCGHTYMQGETTMNKYTYFAGHFDGHCNAAV